MNEEKFYTLCIDWHIWWNRNRRLTSSFAEKKEKHIRFRLQQPKCAVFVFRVNIDFYTETEL